MEGVERYNVCLLEHNPDWEKEFLIVKKELFECWNENIMNIQHVGSTSIQSICAKPILDVAVQLKSIEDMDVDALKLLGYSYCGPRNKNERYHLFVLRGDNEISLRHIHCYDKDEEEFYSVVGFRDYLNTHEDEAKQYEELKKQLAEKYPKDRIAYTAGKEEFILSIYRKIKNT